MIYLYMGIINNFLFDTKNSVKDSEQIEDPNP